MRYKTHKAKWIDCKRCVLHERRMNVVLARGQIPCDLLFVGEAPGAGEDVLGKPFVGPAGKLLDKIIAEAMTSGYVFSDKIHPPRWAFTNLIACIPKGEDGKKVGEPEREHIEACQSRLREFIGIAKPRAIVCVGLHAEKWIPKIWKGKTISIIHPAAILRMDISQKSLAYQRAVVRISDLIEEL